MRGVHETRRGETSAVKRALAEAGITAKVTHGRGTAWGWLEVYVGSEGWDNWHVIENRYAGVRCYEEICGECRRYRALDREATRIARLASGRRDEGRSDPLTDYYDGDYISVMHQDAAGTRILQSGEWSPEAWATADVLERKAGGAAEAGRA